MQLQCIVARHQQSGKVVVPLAAAVPGLGEWFGSGSAAALAELGRTGKSAFLPRFPQQTRMIRSLSQKKPEQEGDPCSGVRSASRT